VFSSCSSFHTSAISFSQASKRASARNKKKNVAQSADRVKEAEEKRPSVVLGTRSAEDSEKWGNCKLSKVLVDEEKLRSTTNLLPEEYNGRVAHMPQDLGYGVQHTEKKLLFEHLPIATLHMTSRVRKPSSFTKEMQEEDEKTELRKANLLALALDLRNANAAGISFENRRRIIEAFSTTENPFDSGRTEVQGMYQIFFLF
jgi:small subunit ribosomal protein S15